MISLDQCKYNLFESQSRHARTTDIWVLTLWMCRGPRREEVIYPQDVNERIELIDRVLIRAIISHIAPIWP